MAYIPDEAIDRMYAELTSGARDLYTFLARCRNQKTGKCCPSINTITESIGLSRARIYAVRKELESKKWATFKGNDAMLLIGYESLKNKTSDVGSAEDSAGLPSVLPETGESLVFKTEKSCFQDSRVLKTRQNSLKNKTNQSCFQDSHIRKNQQIEPAKEPIPGSDASGDQVESTDDSAKARQVIPEYEIFAEKFRDAYGMPYANKRADFVQFRALQSKCEKNNWPLTPERFRQATENYFASELGAHTFADLCVRFSSFYRGRLDRFSKPALNGTGFHTNTLAQKNHEAGQAAYELLFGEKLTAEPAIDAEVIQ